MGSRFLPITLPLLCFCLFYSTLEFLGEEFQELHTLPWYPDRGEALRTHSPSDKVVRELHVS